MCTSSSTPTGHSDSSSSLSGTRSVRKAVIPAAGLGTRLRPLTRAFPKELLPVGREPVLSYIVTELREAGITEALFIVSDSKPQIRNFFGDVYTGERQDLPRLHCSYVTQTEQHGLGDALLYAEPWAGTDAFVVAFGDCIIEDRRIEDRRIEDRRIEDRRIEDRRIEDRREGKDEGALKRSPLQRLIATHLDQASEATVLVEEVERTKVSRYGIVAPLVSVGEVAADGAGSDLPLDPFALRDIVEKPSIETAPSRLAVAARWVVEPGLFPFLRTTEIDARGERNMTDGVRALLATGKTAWAVPLRPGEARRDIGNFESFFAQFVRSALHDPEFGASIRRLAQQELERLSED